ncbi:MAG: PorT family protein [Flavobacteriaceae bacterium]|jgi:opacity protein-like surface antigen|nr:PorT family protein [Flavobacteriaceae bacterium]
MKKTLLLAMLLVGIGQGYAQKKVQPGVRGGLNVSGITNAEGDRKADFYLGFQLPIHLGKRYTLQPELEYSRQGGKDITLKYNNDWWWGTGNTEYVNYKGNVDLSYIEMKVMNKFHFDKLNLQAGPGLGFVADGKKYTDNEVDLTLNIGIGYQITDKLGVEARYKQGLISIVDNYWTWNDDYNHNNRYDRDLQFNSVFQVGLTYTF